MYIVAFLAENEHQSLLQTGIESVISSLDAGDVNHDIVIVKKEFNPLQQQQFMYAALVADVVIVDCTIPVDESDGSVYPALTAHINTLNHIVVVSANNLPLNIKPYRGVYPTRDGEIYSIEQIIGQLPKVITASIKQDTYPRLPEDIYKDFESHQADMEKILTDSLDYRTTKSSEKTRVMISYRNSHSQEVENLKSVIEGEDEIAASRRQELGLNGEYELKVLPPASLCGADEAHTPMRRWMLVGILEDHIREVDEVWVYESRNDAGEVDYVKSWWTLAEMTMVANLNFDSKKQIKVRVFNPVTQKFYEVTPSVYTPRVTKEQHERLARYLSNTRPDTMGPEMTGQVRQLKMVANLLRLSDSSMKEQIVGALRTQLEQSVPHFMGEEARAEMIDNLMKMYSNPDELERYSDDDVFKEEFWSRISYQTTPETSCFLDGHIDIDKFMSIPMDEVTGYAEDEIAKAAKKGKINLGSIFHPNWFNVSKAANNRYLWLATRMGKATLKEGSPDGLERINIYNLSEI